MISDIEIIAKENIQQFHFVLDEVLKTHDEKRLRQASLEKAMILGNGYKGKVKIVFETVEGTKAVETTIWSTDETEITLKGGTNIPIQSIREVLI